MLLPQASAWEQSAALSEAEEAVVDLLAEHCQRALRPADAAAPPPSGGEPADDLTILALRWNGPQGAAA